MVFLWFSYGLPVAFPMFSDIGIVRGIRFEVNADHGSCCSATWSWWLGQEKDSLMVASGYVKIAMENHRKTIGKWWFNGILMGFTLWLCQNLYGKWQFIVDFPMKNGDFP